MNPTNIHLKIFISSTFEDMNQEREDLLKDIFLHIKKEAKKRDVEITEIDLRWGVDENSSSKGQTVKVCLDEIQRCKDSPIFFVGILGNRYGWDKWFETLDKTILEDNNYNWIEEYKDRSITELEIQSALKEQNSYALFFLKKPLKDEETRLIDLKKKIKDESLNRTNIFAEDYNKTEDLKEKILDKFITLLDELFQVTQTKTEVEKLREYHYQFAKSRQKVYIPHKINESRISKFLDSKEDRLLIYGDSGLGKSALISNYFKTYKEQNKNTLVVEHYIGGAGELSNDIYHILKRVIMEIKEYFQIKDEIPNDNDSIINDFAIWLDKVTSPMVIVLDGYNQIEDEIKEKFFYYLPDKLKNIKLIITSIKDNYPIKNRYKIEKLTKDEQKDLIVSYLENYGKKLESNILKNILSHLQVGNTLFLKTLLDEIRLLGNYEKLLSLIDEYLKAKTPIELFDKIFERYENDYEKNTPNLTKDILSLLYVSRDGLSETNLTELLKINRLDFSPLFLALEEHLINKNGLYGFFHDYIKEAVESRYLDQEGINDYRRDIADYFEVREINTQRVRELPYQLHELENKSGLCKNLKDINFFVSVQKNEQYELLKYIKYIEKETKVLEFIKNMALLNKDEDVDVVQHVAYFLDELYPEYEYSKILFEKCIEYCTNKDELDLKKLAKLYHQVASVNLKLNKYEKASKLFKKSLEFKQKIYEVDHYELADTYNSLSYLYAEMQEFEKAYKYSKMAIEIVKKTLGDSHFNTLACYNNMGYLLDAMGKPDEALEYYYRCYEIAKNTLKEDDPDIADYCINIAVSYYYKNMINEAIMFAKKSLKIREKIFGKKHPSTLESLNNLVEIHKKTGNYSESLIIHENILNEYIEMYGLEHLDVADSYNNIADTLKNMSKYDEALIYHQKSLDIKLKILSKKHKKIAESYNNIGELYLIKEDYNMALEFLNVAKNIYKNNLNIEDNSLSVIYLNLGDLFMKLEKYNESIKYLNKSIQIKEKIFVKDRNLAKCYYNQSLCYFKLNNYNLAQDIMIKSINMYSEVLDSHEELTNAQDALINIRKKIKEE